MGKPHREHPETKRKSNVRILCKDDKKNNKTYGILECLNQSQCFIDTTSNRQVVDGDLTQILFIIDNKQSTKWYASTLQINTIILGNFGILISQKWNLQRTETTFLSWSVNPCQMGVMGIGWCGNQFTIDLGKLFRSFRETNNLSWTNKGTIGKGRKQLI